MAVRLISSPRTNQREPIGSLGTNQREPVGSLGTNQREPVGSLGTNQREPVGSLGTSLAKQIRSRSTNQREPIRSTGTSSTGPAPLHHAYNGSSGQRFVDPRAVGNGLRFSSTSAGLPQQQFRGVSPSNVPSNFDHLMLGPVRFQANDSQAIDGNVTAKPQLSVGLSGGSLPSLANPIEQLQMKVSLFHFGTIKLSN
jgi:Mucin-like